MPKSKIYPTQTYLTPHITNKYIHTNTSLPHKNTSTRICYINANGLKTENSDKLKEITLYMSENKIAASGPN